MVDIVIINYNTRQLILECLDSIFNNETIPVQVFVIDNASVDDSVEMISKYYPQVNVIKNTTNEGYGKACNKGIVAGKNPYIVLLNSDTKVTSGWLEPIINVFEKNEDTAVVGSKLLSENNHIMGSGVIGTNANPQIRGWMEPDNGQFNKQIDCISVCGACMMIKRENIPTLGLFDENYFFYYEETDYCYGARDKGYRIIYCPESRVIHHQHGSCKDNELLRRYFDESDKIFHGKWAHMMGDEHIYG